MQALYANEIQQVTPDRLRQWDVTSESLGDILGMALSYSGWKVLEDLVGSQTLSSFAKQEFGRPVHGDVRDWWSDWRTPLPDRFKLSTGLDWEDFVTTWAARLDELRENPDYAAALDKIPTATTSFTAEVTPEGGRILRYKLTVNKPLPADRECTAFHGQLSAYDQPAGMVPLREVSFTRSDSSSLVIEHVISGQYADGTRIYAAIECELAGFDLPVRLGSARFTIL